MSKDSRWIRLAKKLADKHKFPKYRMAAVVVRGGRVIATGVNRFGGAVLKHPAYKLKSIHAELDAILQIDPSLLRNSTIYVAGWTKGNNLCTSKPCEACQKMLRESGIRAVVWHDQDGVILQERIS